MQKLIVASEQIGPQLHPNLCLPQGSLKYKQNLVPSYPGSESESTKEGSGPLASSESSVIWGWDTGTGPPPETKQLAS